MITPIGKVIGDGAYDTKNCYNAIKDKGGLAVIPPRGNACLWPDEEPDHTRNQALHGIERDGKAEWKKNFGYHRRSLVETTMYRLKTIFTGKFKSKNDKSQKLEIRICCQILNQMTALGRPNSHPLPAF